LGPKKGEVTGDWRNLYNDEISNLHSAPNIIGIGYALHVAHTKKNGGVYKILV
jgi:hypothetical protein